MSATTRIQKKGQVTIPTSVREQAGLSRGDLVEFAFLRGTIVITPKAVVDRTDFPNADNEYTLEQRRAIDAQLAEAAKGPFHGPFETHDAMLEFLHREVKKTKSPRKTKRLVR